MFQSFSSIFSIVALFSFINYKWFEVARYYWVNDHGLDNGPPNYVDQKYTPRLLFVFLQYYSKFRF